MVTTMAAVLAAAITAGCTSDPAAAPPPSASAAPQITQPIPPGIAAPTATSGGLLAVHDPGHVTGTITGPCHARGQLPDPRCTPGAADPAITQADIGATICVPGYTRTVRPPAAETDRFKYDVAYPAYGLADVPGAPAELDHLVPLELGGSNDAANLWPETGPVPNPKDSVERALNRAVCAGRIPLRAAQQAIARNWTTALQATP
jgi:hypothetical protein